MNKKMLTQLYAVHDHFEAALRAYEKTEHDKARKSLWKAHDILERIVISAQAEIGHV